MASKERNPKTGDTSDRDRSERSEGAPKSEKSRKKALPDRYKDRQDNLTFVPLTKEFALEVATEKEEENVSKIEIIFTPVHEIAGLDNFQSLRELTLIETNLNRISGLDCLRNSLSRLCLSNQKISVIENLNLPQLRELYLQENQITKLQNLDRCVKLQKFWIYSNRVQRIENLHHLTDLRELWLQDNEIQHVEGVDNLVNLQSLRLANNHVSDLKELHTLLSLPMLRDLALHDDHFGSCPVALHEGYNNWVILNLKQVKILDGNSVQEGQRDQVTDKYLKSVLSFNDKVDALKRESKAQLEQVEIRRRLNRQQSKQAKEALLENLKRLEKIVMDGRSKVQDENKRQRNHHHASLKALMATTDDLKDQYTQEVQNILDNLQQKVEHEKQVYDRILREHDVQSAEKSMMRELQYSSKGTVLGVELDAASPEYKFAAGMVASKGNGTAQNPLCVYRVFNASAEQSFAKAVSKHPLGNKAVMRCFLQVEDNWANLQNGFGSDQVVRVADNIYDASMFSPSNRGQRPCTSEVVLVCKVAVGAQHIVDTDPFQDSAPCLADFESFLPKECSSIGVVSNKSTVHYVQSSQIAPEFWIRFRWSTDTVPLDYKTIDDVAFTSREFEKLTTSLHRIENEVQKQFRWHLQRMWLELDPANVQEIEGHEEEIGALQSTLDALRGQISSERSAQDSLVRELRNQIYTGNGKRQGGKSSTTTAFGSGVSSRTILTTFGQVTKQQRAKE